MQQRVEAIADGTQNGHGTRASADCVEPTRRKRPLIVAPPCQSEIKRTLRRRLRAPQTVFSSAFALVAADHSVAMVNAGFPRLARYGFEMVDMPVAAISAHKNPVNRKFTANRISRFLLKFSPV